ncbi:MAG: tol-pal system protein YbgF [Proteobacteria bacterium]|nr:tol-pal system protein YbgF [Pseudomonadota bacterium]
MKKRLATSHVCHSRLHKNGDGTKVYFLTILFVLLASLFSPPTLYAQDNSDLVVELVNRVAALEAEQRELRGNLDEAHHELSLLHKKMETLNADIDYRFKGSEGGIDPHALTPPESLEEDVIESSSSSTPEKEYEKARALLEKGEYDAAEKAFSAFVNAHPKHEHAAAAQYWLGVTYFVRGMHEKAAASFAKGYKNYPKSSKAPEGLLKLSKCLAALDRKADACATLEQLETDFPKALVKEVASDRGKLKCQ